MKERSRVELVHVLIAITLLGDAAVWVFLGLNVYWLGKRRLSLSFITALLANVVINTLLKNWLRMPRPETFWIVSPEEPYGFPSGHAQTAFFAATFLSMEYGIIALPLYILAGLVAYSRVALGVHYPVDVVGGAVIGSAVGFLLNKATRHEIPVTDKWLVAATVVSTSTGVMLFMFFPVRRALIGGFVSALGCGPVALYKFGKASPPKRRREKVIRMLLGSLSTAALLLIYLSVREPILSALTAFATGFWALFGYPLSFSVKDQRS